MVDFISLDVRPLVIHLIGGWNECTSVHKIVKNLCQNSRAFRHLVYDTINRRTYVSAECSISWDELLLLDPPQILHIHNHFLSFRAEIERALKLLPSLKIAQTIHGEWRTLYPELLDLAICIHQAAVNCNADLNPIVIENSVDLRHVPRYVPIEDQTVCSSLRIIPIRIQLETLEILYLVNGKVKLYGLYENPHSIDLLKHLNNYPNIEIVPQIPEVEYEIIKHQLFFCCYPNNRADLCYGMNVIEAATLGMPIITLERTQAFQYWVKPGVNGYIEHSEKDLVKRINQLLADPVHYRELCISSAEHAKTLNNIMPQQYDEAWTGLLA